MICWNCASTSFWNTLDDFDQLEVTCMLCGRPQITRPVDTTPTGRAEEMEQGLGIHFNTYRQKARRRLDREERAARKKKVTA